MGVERVRREEGVSRQWEGGERWKAENCGRHTSAAESDQISLSMQEILPMISIVYSGGAGFKKTFKGLRDLKTGASNSWQ